MRRKTPTVNIVLLVSFLFYLSSFSRLQRFQNNIAPADFDAATIVNL